MYGFYCTRQNLETGQDVAIKVLHLDSVKDDIENIQKEIQLLSKLDCPYVRKHLPNGK
jgi:serine/threonine protein kinase